MTRSIACALLVAAATTATAQLPPPPEPPPDPRPPGTTQAPEEQPTPRAPAYRRWVFGGGVGAGFGDLSWVDVSPWVGYRATERVTVGSGLLFRWSEDDRFDPGLTATDFGASVFTRYGVTSNLFAHAEYEYLSYEVLDPFVGEDRTGQSSLFLGGGLWYPAGNNVSVGVSVLYDVLHDDDDPFRAYDDPIVVRAGVGVGF